MTLGPDVDAGLCASFTHAEVVTSARASVFHLCRLSFQDPRFRKYPSLPVVACTGYRSSDPTSGAGERFPTT